MDTEKGNIAAQYNLALCHFYGVGTPNNDIEAVRLYRLGAENGLGLAQNSLAYCLRLGIGCEPNVVQAVYWYQLSASQGITRALIDLGDCYQIGNGVEQDAKEAFKLYHLAAEKCDEEARYAQSRLGNCYFSGMGVEQDYEEAVRLFHVASECEGEDSFACYMLGECYSYGYGVERDLKVALKWYSLAEKSGPSGQPVHPEITEILKNYRSPSPVEEENYEPPVEKEDYDSSPPSSPVEWGSATSTLQQSIPEMKPIPIITTQSTAKYFKDSETNKYYITDVDSTGKLRCNRLLFYNSKNGTQVQSIGEESINKLEECEDSSIPNIGG